MGNQNLEKFKVILIFSLLLVILIIEGSFLSCQYQQVKNYFAGSESLYLSKALAQKAEAGIKEAGLKEQTLSEETAANEEQEEKLTEEVKYLEAEISRVKKEIEAAQIAKEEFLTLFNPDLMEEIYKISDNVKGLYMTSQTANSRVQSVARIRQNIRELLDKTKLNAVVIDVKEAYGVSLPYSLKGLIEEFHQNDIWVIARIVLFRDASLKKTNPEFYIRTKEGDFWRDYAGGYWLDPAHPEVQRYLINFSKRVVDFGFDELQFDYFRFPTDGDLKNIAYPVYEPTQKKYKVIGGFSQSLSRSLRACCPKIILSVDLFGYVATQFNSLAIGQRLVDFADWFDYISFMLYPSHFYGGFAVGKDLERGLPALYFPYESQDISRVASNHPYEVVFRSVLTAKDYLDGIDGVRAKIRPWLQDFNLSVDTRRGIFYDAEKVRAQIEAAEDAGFGWLIWNASNIYTEEAF